MTGPGFGLVLVGGCGVVGCHDSVLPRESTPTQLHMYPNIHTCRHIYTPHHTRIDFKSKERTGALLVEEFLGGELVHLGGHVRPLQQVQRWRFCVCVCVNILGG